MLQVHKAKNYVKKIIREFFSTQNLVNVKSPYKQSPRVPKIAIKIPFPPV